VSRRFSNTRCDEGNAYCFCARCHHYYTDRPVAFGIWVVEKMGREDYYRLQKRSQITTKVDWFTLAAELKARWEQIEAAA